MFQQVTKNIPLRTHAINTCLDAVSTLDNLARSITNLSCMLHFLFMSSLGSMEMIGLEQCTPDDQCEPQEGRFCKGTPPPSPASPLSPPSWPQLPSSYPADKHEKTINVCFQLMKQPTLPNYNQKRRRWNKTTMTESPK